MPHLKRRTERQAGMFSCESDSNESDGAQETAFNLEYGFPFQGSMMMMATMIITMIVVVVVVIMNDGVRIV